MGGAGLRVACSAATHPTRPPPARLHADDYKWFNKKTIKTLRKLHTEDGHQLVIFTCAHAARARTCPPLVPLLAPTRSGCSLASPPRPPCAATRAASRAPWRGLRRRRRAAALTTSWLSCKCRCRCVAPAGGGGGALAGAGVWVARLCEPRRRCTRSSRATSPTPPLATLHQVFMATQDDDFRKPGRGMWDFFVEHCNAGVEPDLRCAGTAAARVRGRAQPHAPTVRGTRRVLDLLPACPPGRSQSFFVGDAAGRPTDIGDGSDSDKCAQAAPSHARLQQPYP